MKGVTMLPAYIKIHDQIKKEIDEEIWKIGQRLPSERDLAEQFEVSRMTLRQAITHLTIISKATVLYNKVSI